MQSHSIYLYPNLLNVYDNGVDGTWKVERKRMVYNRGLMAYRSVDNRIDLQVRNSDEKKYNITGSTIVFNIINKENSDLVLSKDCSVDDLTRGRVYVVLTTDELQELEPGFYNYSIVKEVRQTVDSTDYKVTSRTPLYFDPHYGAMGNLEIMGDVLGTPYNTIEVYKFKKDIDWDSVATLPSDTPQFNNPRPNFNQTNTSNQVYDEYHYSSIVDLKPNMQSPNSLHTLQFYFKNYEGQVVIQGSLADGGTPSADSWYDLQTFDVTSTDSNMFKNQTGKHNWFRIKHEPTKDNTGSLDKILVR
jgi:hypothetical protein